MSEIKKNTELTDKELEQVSGGVQQNEDGTYTFRNSDTFWYGKHVYMVLGDYPNVRADEMITVFRRDTLDSISGSIDHYTAAELYKRWQSAGADSTPISN